jgi:hypothetical protein
MKKQTLSVEQVVDAYNAFDLFGATDKPGDVGLTAILIVDKLEGTARSFNKAREKLVEKYALTRTIPPAEGSEIPTIEFVPAKDKQGKVMHGSKQVDPLLQSEFNAEFDAMIAVTVEVTTPVLKSEDLAKLTIPPNILKAIKHFIVWAPEK